jgi:hypothetical protein
MPSSSRGALGDAVEHYKKYLIGRPALAFCASVAGAEEIAAYFTQARHSGDVGGRRDEDGRAGAPAEDAGRRRADDYHKLYDHQ